jgi:hypothetical protein
MLWIRATLNHHAAAIGAWLAGTTARSPDGLVRLRTNNPEGVGTVLTIHATYGTDGFANGAQLQLQRGGGVMVRLRPSWWGNQRFADVMNAEPIP